MLNRQRFDNIAAAAQQYLEELLTKWVQTATKKWDIHNVACAGGIFLNVKANKRICRNERGREGFLLSGCR